MPQNTSNKLLLLAFFAYLGIKLSVYVLLQFSHNTPATNGVDILLSLPAILIYANYLSWFVQYSWPTAGYVILAVIGLCCYQHLFATLLAGALILIGKADTAAFDIMFYYSIVWLLLAMGCIFTHSLVSYDPKFQNYID